MCTVHVGFLIKVCAYVCPVVCVYGMHYISTCVTVCVGFSVALKIFILVVYRVLIYQCQADMDMEKRFFFSGRNV